MFRSCHSPGKVSSSRIISRQPEWSLPSLIALGQRLERFATGKDGPSIGANVQGHGKRANVQTARATGECSSLELLIEHRHAPNTPSDAWQRPAGLDRRQTLRRRSSPNAATAASSPSWVSTGGKPATSTGQGHLYSQASTSSQPHPLVARRRTTSSAPAPRTLLTHGNGLQLRHCGTWLAPIPSRRPMTRTLGAGMWHGGEELG